MKPVILLVSCLSLFSNCSSDDEESFSCDQSFTTFSTVGICSESISGKFVETPNDQNELKYSNVILTMAYCPTPYCEGTKIVMSVTNPSLNKGVLPDAFDGTLSEFEVMGYALTLNSWGDYLTPLVSGEDNAYLYQGSGMITGDPDNVELNYSINYSENIIGLNLSGEAIAIVVQSMTKDEYRIEDIVNVDFQNVNLSN